MALEKGALKIGDLAAQGVSRRIYGAVDAEADLEGIAPEARYDGMIAIELTTRTPWVFDKDSSASAVTGSVRVPTTGTGRWLAVQIAGAGAAADALMAAFLVACTASVGAKLTLLEATNNGTSKVTMAAPASLAANRTITVPDADVNLGLIATAVQAASCQTARGVMVAGSVTFSTLTLTAASLIVPMKEIEDGAASGLLTVGAITPGAPGSVTITSANGAETSTIRILVIG
jgi:hypothetical protein